jgi:hypothetical protein
MIRTTYTYALMDVSEQTYYEIYDKLREAGYDHCIVRDDGDVVLDLHGIALRKRTPDEKD